MTDELRIEWMRLDEIREAERNSKLHDLDELDRSIDALGFTTELKYDERTERLIRGHGRLADLRRKRDRGDAVPEGIRDLGDDWAAPVVRGWSSRDPHHATAVALADNFVGKSAGSDEATLLDELSDLAADAPDLLAATTHTSDDLDRLLASASGGVTELPTALIPDDTDRPGRERRDDEQWESGSSPDEGSTREDDGPGLLDVEPAWRTLQPTRAIYHDGTPEGADRVVRWLRTHAHEPHANPDLSVSWITPDGDEYLPPGKWVTRDGQTGALDLWTREEFDDRFVAANEPARRAMRDAAPVKAPKAKIPAAAELLRHGSGVL